jgi:hypothetical protein
MANSARGGNGARNAQAQAQAQTTYSDFLATHPPTFAEAGEPLEVDNWLQTIEFKFDLLCCTEIQKTLFTVQQLLGASRAWWVNYTATHPNDLVQWAEFRAAFRAQHIPPGVMHRKRQEFLDLWQGRRFVYDYSKIFNQLAQYASEQVDTDEKKKDCFMRGLSTKLQERLALCTGGTFPEFASNAIIVDDAIRTHKESKKRKAVATPSGSTPLGYRMVYDLHHTQASPLY